MARKKTPTNTDNSGTATAKRNNKRKDTDDDAAPPPKAKRQRSNGKAAVDEVDEDGLVHGKRPPVVSAAGGGPLEKELVVPQVEEGKESMLKITTLNVNGMRAAVKKGFVDWVKGESPDVLAVQEVKAELKDVKKQLEPLAEEYTIMWNASYAKKGYAGTAVFVKKELPGGQKVLSHRFGIKTKGEDDEHGRCITVEFNDFYLVNTYVPNAGAGLVRLQPRTEKWDPQLQKHLAALRTKKPVVWTGDLNVAHQNIDIHEPVRNRNKTPGFSDAERRNFARALKNGPFVDLYRHLYPDDVDTCFTYWSYRFNGYNKNKGWRLDYFVATPDLVDRVLDVHILQRAPRISDHCPLTLYLKNQD